MNDVEVYGNIICRVSVLNWLMVVSRTSKVHVKEFDIHQNSKLISSDVDCEHLISTMDDVEIEEDLVCVKTSRQLVNLMSHTDFTKSVMTVVILSSTSHPRRL